MSAWVKRIGMLRIISVVSASCPLSTAKKLILLLAGLLKGGSVGIVQITGF
jgi:hypothetical protein